MKKEIIDVLKYNLNFIVQLVSDLSEQEMIKQPEGIPNHAVWTIGHIIHSCEGMAKELGSDKWLPDNWESLFGYGSNPYPDYSNYPGKSELISLIGISGDNLTKTILQADIKIWGKSLEDESFPTMSHLLLQVIIAHTAYHAGQLAMWRRAMSKKSVGVFI
jgi:hypothetical protein